MPFLVPILSSASVNSAVEKLIPDIQSTEPKFAGGVTTLAAVLSSYALCRKSAHSTSLAGLEVYFAGRGSSETHTSQPVGHAQLRLVGCVVEEKKVHALKWRRPASQVLR